MASHKYKSIFFQERINFVVFIIIIFFHSHSLIFSPLFVIFHFKKIEKCKKEKKKGRWRGGGEEGGRRKDGEEIIEQKNKMRKREEEEEGRRLRKDRKGREKGES